MNPPLAGTPLRWYNQSNESGTPELKENEHATS